MWERIKKITVLDFLIAIAILIILAGVFKPSFESARRNALSPHPSTGTAPHAASR
jgi:Tfp pilus assembly protein PilE